MQTLLIPYSSSLIDEVYNHLIPDDSNPKDYSNNIVVFPGRRPAHFLRKVIAEKARSATIPPLIYSIDEFVKSFYSETTRRIEAIDAAAILYKINETNPYGMTGAHELSPDEFFQIGLRIFNDIEELYIEGVEPYKIKDIGEISGVDIPPKSYSNLQTLFTFYTEFYKICKEQGYSTRSIQYRDAAEILKTLPIVKPIIFAGFFALTWSERSIFKSLMKTDNSVFLFQEGIGISDLLKDLDITSSKPLSSDKPKYFFYKSPDTHGQIFALNKLINSSKNLPDINSVIVMPQSDTLFALYNHVLTPLGEENYNISMGYPLYRTPIYSFINSLTELIISMNDDRLYVPDYLKFVLHPYTKNIYFSPPTHPDKEYLSQPVQSDKEYLSQPAQSDKEYLKDRADITRIIFHKIQDWFTQNRSMLFVTLNDIENNEDLLIEIEKVEPSITANDIKAHLKAIHDQTIRKFLAFENTRDFAIKTIEILVYIYENSTANRHPFFYPFNDAFINSLTMISNSLFGDISFHHISGYFNLFKKFINLRRVPFEGAPLKGLQVLGALESRNLRFKCVYILDMNEGIMPSNKEDSSIPLKVKNALGLSTYKDNERLIEYYLDILCKGAEAVHLFYVENVNKEPSRFIEKLLWEREFDQGRLDIPVHGVQYKMDLSIKPVSDIPKTSSIIDFLLNEFSYSASALDTYLRCELQFYYQYVLRLREREEASGRIEKIDIGLLVHEGLYKYFLPFKDRKLTPSEFDLKRLDEIIGNLFNFYYGSDLSGSVYLLKRQIIYQLRRFLEYYQIPRLDSGSHYIIGLEERLQTIWNGFKLKGQIDRIDRCNGRINIIDYKTSSSIDYLKIRFKGLDLLSNQGINQSNRHIISDNIKSLQLLFYNILYSNALNTDKNIIDCMFLLLGKSGLGKSDNAIEKILFSNQREREYFNILSDIMLFLLKEITDPKIPFRAETRVCSIPQAGSNCLYINICGRG